MPITPRNLVRHELIGLDVGIVYCTDKKMEGMEGAVIDETRNMLVIRTAKGDKRIAKESATFSFRLPSGEGVRVDGKIIVSRPEDRIKRKLRKW
ncbi:MAG: ribonuclease P protein component 1 [Candidatus Aenigmarchaeota archaeon]|nr:ribonuclease P protein component 1 [Candidatus Aenigmarchaeota archaeon]